jgi:hypothetical protein
MSVLQDPTAPRHVRRLEASLTPSRPEGHDGDTTVAERAAWTLVWLGVLTGGIDLWGFWWSSPLTVVLAGVITLGGIVGMTACWVVRSPRSTVLQALGLGAALVAVAFPEGVIIHTRLFYTTDSAAFDDVASRALLHGSNPYTTSLSGAARLLDVPDRFWTYTIAGGHVTHASYPAGSFLVNVPAMALGMHHHVVDWMDLTAWVVTGLLLFAFMPAALRWLAALVVLTPIFAGMFGNSGTDATFLPFLVVAVWRWDRFALGPDAGRVRWLGPIALGVACAIKQLPWFCVPFLLLGVAIEARRRGRSPFGTGVRYLVPVVVTFAVINLPFALWSPGPWLHGTLTPFVDPLIADGQGLVALATHGVTGGADLAFLAAAGALALVALLGAFATWYSALKRVWPLLLPAAFFFSARSLSSYLVDLFPVAVVAAVTVADAPASSRPLGSATRHRRSDRGRGLIPWVAVGMPTAGVVVCSALAFSSAPLQLSVLSVQSSHRGRVLDAVTVTVHNPTDAALSPHFLVNTGNQPNGFWKPSGGGGTVVRPHGTVTLTLRSPVQTTAPEPGARWLVEAYTSTPRALSTSPMVVWSRS